MSKMGGEITKFARSKAIDISNFEFGKIPPKAIDQEQYIIGSMMVDPDAIDIVANIINENAFYLEAHQLIYKAIKDLKSKNIDIDIIAVAEELRKQEKLDVVGGPFAIAELTNNIASTANVEYHCRIVAEKFIQREIIRISSIAVKEAYEDSVDVFDLLDKTNQEIYQLSANIIGNESKDLNSILDTVSKQIQVRRNEKRELIGISSGFKRLDDLLLGFQPDRLYVIGARPGMGKTSFTLNIAVNIAISGIPAMFFSLEMSKEDLGNKIIASHTGIDIKKIHQGNLSEKESATLHSKVAELRKNKLFIDDSTRLNIFQLSTKLRKKIKEDGIKLVVIDYLQLMEAKILGNRFTNKDEEINSISTGLKNVSKELKIPIICLSQLNRDLEKRGGSKRPTSSDLRGSGGIEQDADVIGLLYRPAYYGIFQNENGQDITNETELIISKNRHGDIGTLYFNYENQKYTEK